MALFDFCRYCGNAEKSYKVVKISLQRIKATCDKEQ